MSFVAELKRRNVFRAAALYAASAWLLVQVATQVFPFFHIADWVVRWIIVAAVIGFPFWLAFAWLYQWTPQGLQRESEVATPLPTGVRESRRNVDRWIIAMLAGAVVLLLADKFVLRNQPAPGATTGQKSVAVLPFSDLSPEGDQQFFGDGLAEELLDVLVQIDGLAVASRTSSFAFKGKNLPIPEIARTLGVAHIVEGSVRRAGDRLRVTAQLIDVATDRHLWSQTFDRQATDVFAIQDEIAKAIADALRVRLGGAVKAEAGTDNVAAYELYLRGLYHWNQRTEPSLRVALEMFREATERDPKFSRAFAGLSLTYAVLPGYAEFDRKFAIAEGEKAARKALELDPQSAEALTALGHTYRLRQNMVRAVEFFDRAISLNPKFVPALHWKGIALTLQGRFPEGEAVLRKALILDPALLPLRQFLAVNLAWQRRFPEAVAEALATLERAPDYRNALFDCFDYTAIQGKPREQLDKLERYFQIIGESPSLAASIAAGMESPDARSAAIQALQAIVPRHTQAGRLEQVTELFAHLRAEEETLKLLEMEREDLIFPHWPAHDFLRGNARYEELLARHKEQIETLARSEAKAAP